MAINPFEFFQVGQSIGQARSPVAGVGGAIRNVLDQAQKVGLIQAQGNAQYSGALNLAAAKDKLTTSQPATDPNNPQVRDIGGIPHVLEDVIQDGKVVGKRWKSTRTPSMFEQFDVNAPQPIAPEGQGAGTGGDDFFNLTPEQQAQILRGAG